jgi:hypothetical protein
MAANNVYDSLRVARGYAVDRPPVHADVAPAQTMMPSGFVVFQFPRV